MGSVKVSAGGAGRAGGAGGAGSFEDLSELVVFPAASRFQIIQEVVRPDLNSKFQVPVVGQAPALAGQGPAVDSGTMHRTFSGKTPDSDGHLAVSAASTPPLSMSFHFVLAEAPSAAPRSQARDQLDAINHQRQEKLQQLVDLFKVLLGEKLTGNELWSPEFKFSEGCKVSVMLGKGSPVLVKNYFALFKTNLEWVAQRLEKSKFPYKNNLIQTLPQLLRNYQELMIPVSMEEMQRVNLLLGQAFGQNSAAAVTAAITARDASVRTVDLALDSMGSSGPAGAGGPGVLPPAFAGLADLIDEFKKLVSLEKPSGLFERKLLKEARKERAAVLKGVNTLLEAIDVNPSFKRAETYSLLINFILAKFSEIDMRYPLAGISGRTKDFLNYLAGFQTCLLPKFAALQTSLNLELKDLSDLTALSPVSRWSILEEAVRVSGEIPVGSGSAAARASAGEPGAGAGSTAEPEGSHDLSDLNSNLLRTAGQIRQRCFYQNLLEMYYAISLDQTYGRRYGESIAPISLSVEDIKVKFQEHLRVNSSPFDEKNLPDEFERLQGLVENFLQVLPRLRTIHPDFAEQLEKIAFNHLLLNRFFGAEELAVFLRARGLDSSGAAASSTTPLLNIPVPLTYCHSLSKAWASVEQEGLSLRRWVAIQQFLEKLFKDFDGSGSANAFLAKESLGALCGAMRIFLSTWRQDRGGFEAIDSRLLGRRFVLSEMKSFLEAEIRKIQDLYPEFKTLKNLEKILVLLDQEGPSPLEALHAAMMACWAYQREFLLEGGGSRSVEGANHSWLLEKASDNLQQLKALWTCHQVESQSPSPESVGGAGVGETGFGLLRRSESRGGEATRIWLDQLAFDDVLFCLVRLGRRLQNSSVDESRPLVSHKKIMAKLKEHFGSSESLMMQAFPASIQAEVGSWFAEIFSEKPIVPCFMRVFYQADLQEILKKEAAEKINSTVGAVSLIAAAQARAKEKTAARAATVVAPHAGAGAGGLGRESSGGSVGSVVSAVSGQLTHPAYTDDMPNINGSGLRR